jgi:hypothetical protein
MALLAGCATNQKPHEAEFEKKKWIFDSIRSGTQFKLFEGLPHPLFDIQIRKDEISKKATIQFDGELFYPQPLKLKNGDLEKLIAVLGDSGSFKARDLVPKPCGGFHADFAFEWTHENKASECLICFGCFEVMLIGPSFKLHCDIADQEKLAAILRGYREQRPINSEREPPWRSSSNNSQQNEKNP